MTIEQIKKFASRDDLPKQLRLNKATLIRDVKHFFESHLRYIESDSHRNVKMPYYDRIILAMKLIDGGSSEVEEAVEIKVEEVVEEVVENKIEEVVAKVEQKFKEEVKEKTEQEVDFSTIENAPSDSTMRPNKDFETSIEPAFEPRIEPAPAVVQEVVKEPVKKEQPQPKKDDGQTSLF